MTPASAEAVATELTIEEGAPAHGTCDAWAQAFYGVNSAEGGSKEHLCELLIFPIGISHGIERPKE